LSDVDASAWPYVEIFTDGACSPNPGIGGWAAILVSPGHGNFTKELSGAEARTTNNRMELMGAIQGLNALKRPCRVKLVTDSQYLSEAFSAGWLENWKRKGWRTSSRQPVQNEDLWRELDRLAHVHQISWEWVRGHNAHVENERADQLAVEAREALRAQLQGS
jgi:ribonuclease HI